MKTYDRLKYFIDSLGDEHRSKLESVIKKEGTQYSSLFKEVQTKSYEEYIGDTKRKKQNIKSLNDTAEYLIDKILNFISDNSTSELSKKLKALVEIDFLLKKEIEDLAWNKTEKLLKKLDLENEGWISAYLMQRFWDKRQKFPNANYVYVLLQYAKNFAGFNNNYNSDPSSDFIAFIEKYKKQSTDVLNTINNFNKELFLLPSENNATYPLRMQLLLKKAHYIYSNKSFLPNEFFQSDDYLKLENEINNCARNNYYLNNQYTMTAFYTESVLSTSNLIYSLAKGKSEIQSNPFLFDDLLIDDLSLRIETNRMVMKSFTFEPHQKDSQIRAEEIRKGITTLINKGEEKEEFCIFFKTMLLLFNEFDLKKAPSTQYKYKNEIKNFENTFYSSALELNINKSEEEINKSIYYMIINELVNRVKDFRKK